jgi:hypothetical protein
LWLHIAREHLRYALIRGVVLCYFYHSMGKSGEKRLLQGCHCASRMLWRLKLVLAISTGRFLHFCRSSLSKSSVRARYICSDMCGEDHTCRQPLALWSLPPRQLQCADSQREALQTIAHHPAVLPSSKAPACYCCLYLFCAKQPSNSSLLCIPAGARSIRLSQIIPDSP